MAESHDPSLSSEIKFHLVRRIEHHKVIGLAGLRLLPHEAKYLEFHRVSGVILFARNVESIAQLGELIEEVEGALTVEGRSPLIMADHEGDLVSELRRLIGVPPSPMAIAATGDPALARDVAGETGEAMRKLGVNVVLAPVADCFLEPSSPITGLRTFGRDPRRVGEFVSATVEGFHDAGVLTCAKHFPGHGATDEDSHVGLPWVLRTPEELRGVDLVPFRSAIAAGTDLVMASHIAFAFDEEEKHQTPASFDPRILRLILRDELGFDGAIITDALEMEGARAHAHERYGGLTGGFERSLLAGSDLLLYASPVPERLQLPDDARGMIAVEMMQTIIDTLSRVVDRSRAEEKLVEAAKVHEGVRNLLAILDASEARVLRLREKASDLRRPPVPREEHNVIDLRDYATVPAIYKRVAERSLVLARDPARFVPVDARGHCLLVPIEYRPGESLKRQELLTFIEGLRRSFPDWRSTRPVVAFGGNGSGRREPRFGPSFAEGLLEPSVTLTRGAERLPEGVELLPILSLRGRPPEEWLERAKTFLEQRAVRFVIVTGWPLIDWIPEDVGCLVTFGASGPVAAAAAAILAGQAEASGTLRGIV